MSVERQAASATPADPGGRIALLGGDGLVWTDLPREDDPVPPQGAAFARTELITIAAVDLPLASRQQRAAAAPFAVEDMLSEPLARMHVALGPEISPRRHLVAAVSDALMARWIEDLARAGLPQADILPDIALVPPPEAADWAVRVIGDRALVRRMDGGGFAAPAGSLAALWDAAGRPGAILHGPTAPPGVDCVPAAEAGVRRGAVAVGLNLRQGAYAADRRGAGRWLRRWGGLIAVGAAAVGAVYAADTIALLRQADGRRAEAAALLTERAPGAAANDAALAATLLSLARPDDAATQGRFLPLFSRAAAALRPVSEGLAFRALDFDDGDGTLAMEIEAPDLSALQRIEAGLEAAGFAPEVGAATVADGAAAARVILPDPGPLPAPTRSGGDGS